MTQKIKEKIKLILIFELIIISAIIISFFWLQSVLIGIFLLLFIYSIFTGIIIIIISLLILKKIRKMIKENT